MDELIAHRSEPLDAVTVVLSDTTPRGYKDVRLILYANRSLRVYRNSEFSDAEPFEDDYAPDEWREYLIL